MKEESKKTETQPVEEEKKISKKKVEASNSFEFSDADVAEFKKWQESKKGAGEIRCDSASDDKVYRAWKEESQLVKGVFRCRQPEGGSVRFPFRKYKWDQVQWYTMFDGETYEIPLAVARHLNQNCSYPEHSHILGPDGNPTIDRMGKMKSRMNFESTQFAVA